MECANCGNVLEENAVVCDLCGATFETVEFNTVDQSMKINQDNDPVAIIKRPRRRKINPPPMSLLQYVYMLIVVCIPIGGVIMTFLWAFNTKDNPNRTNLARAILIVDAVIILVFVLLSIVFGNIIGEFVKNYFTSL